ncbi:hypothetical protein D3C83_42250 [compost metagenome]
MKPALAFPQSAAAMRGVLMKPGAMALTVTLCGPSSSARLLVRPMIPPFAAA